MCVVVMPCYIFTTGSLLTMLVLALQNVSILAVMPVFLAF